MLDGMNTVMMICAAVAALAFGVLLAYVCCKALFGALRLHAESLHAESGGSEASVAQVQTAV